MKIYGKDYFFAKTVGAVCNIQKLIQDSGKDGKLFTDDMPYYQSQSNAAHYIDYLHQGYVKRQTQESMELGQEYEDPLKGIGYEELLNLDEDLFNSLFLEAAKVYSANLTQVKGEPAKTGKKTEKARP